MARISAFLKKPRNQAIVFVLIVFGTYAFLSRPMNYAWDVAVVGDFAFVANSVDGLDVVDTADPNNPVKVGNFDSPGDARAIFISGHYLYLADGNAGLQIINILNPASPERVAWVDTPGFAEDVVVVDQFAYVADRSDGLQVISVANPNRPVLIRNSAVSGRITSVAASGKTLYAVDRGKTFRVININNPRNPIPISSYNVKATVNEIFVGGNIAYLAADSRGLVLLNISNSEQIEEISSFKTSSKARGVTVAGIYAYVADGNGLTLLDTSDVTQIRQVSSRETRGDATRVALRGTFAHVADGRNGLVIIDSVVFLDMDLIGESSPQMKAEDVAKDGKYLYVAAGERGVRVLDVSNPQSPNSVSFYDTSGYSMGVTISGDRAFVADKSEGLLILEISNPLIIGSQRSQVKVGDDSYDVAVSGNFAYLADGKNGLRIVDVSQPLTPTQTGHLPLPGNAVGAAVLGEFVYMANGIEGLKVVNVSEPTIPTELGAFKTAGEAKAVDVFTINTNAPPESEQRYQADLNDPGTRVYTALAYGSTGLYIVDVTDPRLPQLVGFLDTQGTLEDVKVVRDRAYLANSAGLVQVVDISDLAIPTLVGIAETPGQAHGLTLDPGYIYVADFERGVSIFDASNENAIVLVGRYDAPATVKYVAVQNNTTYVVDGRIGMWVVDVSDPQNLREVGSFTSAGESNYVSLLEPNAYIADGTAGLQVVDITNPANPISIGTRNTPGIAHSVTIANNHAFMAAGESGLQILNVADPGNIVESGAADTPGNARRVALGVNDYAYVACVEGGLAVIKVADLRNPSMISVYDQLRNVRGVAVAGNYGFVAAGENGFRIFDISHPIELAEIYIEEPPLWAEDVVLADVYAFIAGGNTGLRAMDISDPLNPYLAMSTSTIPESEAPHSALGIAVVRQSAASGKSDSGSYLLYVADDTAGLKVYKATKNAAMKTVGLALTPNLFVNWGLVFFDVLIIGFLGLILWIGFFSQFVLPVSSGDERRQVFDRLIYFMTGRHGMAIHVRDGKIIQHAGEQGRRGPGVILSDLSSAVVLTRRGLLSPVVLRRGVRVMNNSISRMGRLARGQGKRKTRTAVRVVGPGLTFTSYQDASTMRRWDEAILGAVDLRPQIRLRPQVSGYTRDGIEIKSNIFTIFTLGQPPSVLKVTYDGDMQAENLRVIYLGEQGRGAELVKIVKDLVDELDDDDKGEIHRFVQTYGQVAQPIVIDATPRDAYIAAPFSYDPQRVFAAIAGEAQDDQDERRLDWTDLPPHAATEVFRNLLAHEFYDYLYKPEEPEQFPLRDLMNDFANRVRNLGVLSFQFVARRDGQSLVKGYEWDEDALALYPEQELRTPKVMRVRGIKVIRAGFTELMPVSPEVRLGLLEYWRSRWQKDATVTKAGYDLEAARIRKMARVEAQRDMIYTLSQIFQSKSYSDEAMVLRVFQALEAAAADPQTRRLLPSETINMLNSLRYWLMPGGPGDPARPGGPGGLGQG